MKIVSDIEDGLLEARSLLLEMTISEYLNIGKDILSKNKYQRRRVQGGTAMYSLLFRDLLRKCTMPPLVLAFDDKNKGGNLNDKTPKEEVESIMSSENLLILDGLQRTYTMFSILEDSNVDEQKKEEYLAHIIRVEVYVGLTRTGILYRMLTLNSGQTPMSKRHQIEILYSRYKESDLGDIKFVCQADSDKKLGLDMYDFDDAIEGFNSFINGDESPIDKFEIREIVERMEKITNDDYQKEIFEDYIRTYNSFVHRIDRISNSWAFSDEVTWRPFGRNISQIFCKSQPMSAFGAAIGTLIQNESIKSLHDIQEKYDSVIVGNAINTTFYKLLSNLEEIRTRAPKIGVEQRFYLRLFFLKLFDPKGQENCNIFASVEKSFQQYKEERWK